MNGEVLSGRPATRVPPHSREAEESVLGAVLLSIDAANDVMDRLHADDFYVPAHQSIFESMRRLYDGNQAIDAVTLSEELRRGGELEKVGGVTYLTRLVDVVPVTSNVDWYADIVEDNARRRDLIRAGSSVTSLAFDLDDEIHSVMDRAEQTVLSVADRRIAQNLLEVGPLFQDVLEHMEMLEAQGSEITGLATGFKDLDQKLAGLQNANLVVIAARPAMGKCLAAGTMLTDAKTGERFTIDDLVDDRTRHEVVHLQAIDENSKKLVTVAPTDFLDQGIRATFRVTTRLGRCVEVTGDHPFLTIDGWAQLSSLVVGDAIAVPEIVDIFGVDAVSDAEVAVLGYLIGDGTVTAGTPRFSTKSDAIRDDLTRWLDLLCADLHKKGPLDFSLVGRRGPSQADVALAGGVSPSTVSLALSGSSLLTDETRDRVVDAAETLGYKPGSANPIVDLLSSCGLYGCGAADKFVPPMIFRLSERQIALFLNRLYATDGSAWTSVNYYRIEYSTISERLAKDLQHLLLRFGIAAKLRRRSVRYGEERRVAFDVSFQDPQSVRIFAERIGIFGKEPQLKRVVEMASNRTVVQRAADRLPVEVWNYILSAKGHRKWAAISTELGRPRNHNWHVHTRGVSRRLLSELADALDSDELRSLSEGNAIWDPIISIEPAGNQRVYDLTIPIHHNFVANDIVVHNSALTLNIASNVAAQGKPVALFSLEMSKEEIVQRILSSVGRVDSMKLRSGQLGPLWQRVVDAASRMYKAPIFIDDSPIVTITDIRAKCRRLKRKSGLSMVIVDYIQLMEGSARENRQQEIAEISRNLKNLARELEVPVVALSQLNRSLESREDKRPRLSDLRESGCLTADTRLVRADTNQEMTLGELVESGATDVPVWSLDERFRLVCANLTRAFSSGTKRVFDLELASGKAVRGSGNHPFLTLDGWKRLDELEVGDRIATPRRLPQPTGAEADLSDDQDVDDSIPPEVWDYIRYKAMPAAGMTARELVRRLGMSYCGSALYKSGVSRQRMRRLAGILDDRLLRDLAESDVLWDRVTAVIPRGEAPVFDVTVDRTHNFVANGIVAHNSIEQDADVVMFIYRHEYYHPEDQENKGLAEVIVAKHRAGSTGPVRMTFLPEFTRFADLGRDVT